MAGSQPTFAHSVGLGGCCPEIYTASKFMETKINDNDLKASVADLRMTRLEPHYVRQNGFVACPQIFTKLTIIHKEVIHVQTWKSLLLGVKIPGSCLIFITNSLC